MLSYIFDCKKKCAYAHPFQMLYVIWLRLNIQRKENYFLNSLTISLEFVAAQPILLHLETSG